MLSIVFRLAGSEEYSSNQFKLYTDRIENYFNRYKNHEIIPFVKKIRTENGIGFDVVMSMAIHLDDDLNPLAEFTDQLPEQRWEKQNSAEFLRLLQKFRKDTQFDDFFKSNESLYQQVSNRFLPIYEKSDLNWYYSFYGKEPDEKFVIINGVGNGGGNYGPSVYLTNDKREVYAIMGTWRVDSSGKAVYKMNE